MKINIEVDITPEEFRALMGWPDIQGLQNDVIAQFREKMAENAQGYDPLTLMAPYLGQSADALQAFQKMMGGFVQGYAKRSGGDSKD